MGKKKHVNLWRGMSAITASLLTFSVAGTAIASENASVLNTQLGTTSYKLVEKGDGDSDSTYFDSEFTSVDELTKAGEELAAEIASEGSVLLKNTNDALPIDKSGETVTLWGMNSHTPTLGGMIGSSTGMAEDTTQVAYGIEEALAAKGFTVNQDMINLYSSDAAMAYARRGFGQTGHGLMPSFGATYESPAVYPVGEIPSSLYTDDLLSKADKTTAVVVISRDSSEAADYEPNMMNMTDGDSFETPLSLSDYEKEMITLAKEHSTKVIVLVNADNTMEIDELKEDADIDSILWVGAPGLNGFLGVADVLSGDVNPSAALPDTYATDSTSSPAMSNYGLYMYTNSTQAGSAAELTEEDKADWYVVETEGIYTGYKYYETRYEDSILGQGNADATEGSSNDSAWNYADEMTYSFGYGLSYTTFEQKLDSVNVAIGGEGTAEVTVTNTGDVAGKSIVELYVQAPYTKGGLEKAAIQLIGYGKTAVLESGASEKVTVTFDPEYMASYDEDAVKNDETTGAWSLEAGDYYFAIGNGAHEALNNVLASKTGTTDGLVSLTDSEVVNAENAVKWNLGSTDIETYSEGVQNQLQDMDINNFIENAAEYTTREDWTKGWVAVETLTPTDEMMEGLTNSKYELTENGDGVTWGKDSGLKLIDFMLLDEEGNYAGVVDINDPMWDQLMDQITLDEAINYIEKMGDDIEAIDSIMLPVTYENDGPLGFTFDQVGGFAIRWTESQSSEPTYVSTDSEYATYAMNIMPTEPVVAATFNAELVTREGEILGELGLWSNESGIIAPGMNLHRTPYCARNHEYYSEDAMLTNLMGVSLCTGAQSKGLTTIAKHFAFNHQELNRSGMSTFMTEQAARENELRGFQGIMQGNVTGDIMTAFNRAGVDFVGAKESLLTGIARNEWGYTGAMVTDMINGADYMNWRDITFAGGGGCLTSSAYETSKIGTMAASKTDIAKDTDFQLEMKKSIKYSLYNLVASNAMNGLTNTTVIVTVITWWQWLCYGLMAGFGVLTLLSLIMYGVNAAKKEEN